MVRCDVFVYPISRCRWPIVYPPKSLGVGGIVLITGKNYVGVTASIVDLKVEVRD